MNWKYFKYADKQSPKLKRDQTYLYFQLLIPQTRITMRVLNLNYSIEKNLIIKSEYSFQIQININSNL